MTENYSYKASFHLLFCFRGHSLVQEFITKDYQASVQEVLDQALAGVETA